MAGSLDQDSQPPTSSSPTPHPQQQQEEANDERPNVRVADASGNDRRTASAAADAGEEMTHDASAESDNNNTDDSNNNISSLKDLPNNNNHTHDPKRRSVDAFSGDGGNGPHHPLPAIRHGSRIMSRGSTRDLEEDQGHVLSPVGSDHHVFFPAVDPRHGDRKGSHISQKSRIAPTNGNSDHRKSSAVSRSYMASKTGLPSGQERSNSQHRAVDAIVSKDRKRLMSQSESWRSKSNGRKWMTSIKLCLWFTSVFTFVFCFFYFFLHVLLLVKVWDPVHNEPPVRDAGSPVDQAIGSVELGAKNGLDSRTGLAASAENDDDVENDDHRHSREKSIMSLVLTLILSFHSIIFYIFSSTLSKSIRTIDFYHRGLIENQEPVYMIDPVTGLMAPTNTGTNHHHNNHSHHHHHHHHHHHRHSSCGHAANLTAGPNGRNSGCPHHEQYHHRKSTTRSRMDEEMGITRRDRRTLMYSFFGVLAALLCLLIHAMVQFVFCLALYQPYMDLMDCLLLILSSFIIIFSLSFVFVSSYYHRRKIYA